MSYHCTILHHSGTGRFHPMVFRPSPRPSEDLVPGQVCRHKSIGHHTVGFESLEDAMKHCADSEWWYDGQVLMWEADEDIPASTGYYPFMTKEQS